MYYHCYLTYLRNLIDQYPQELQILCEQCYMVHKNKHFPMASRKVYKN